MSHISEGCSFNVLPERVCVCVCALTRSNGGHREDAVSNKLAVFLKHRYPQRGQRREHHLEGG